MSTAWKLLQEDGYELLLEDGGSILLDYTQFSITIGGVNRTEFINWQSLRISQILTKQIDTAEFSLLQKTLTDFKPEAGQEVIITEEGGAKIFAGIIVEVESRPIGYKTIEYTIRANDYGRILDSKLVSTVYENETVDDIIDDLVANYLPTGVFTANNVDCPIVIKYLQLNYLSGQEVMNKLADLTGYDWYVDYNKDIHFFIPQPATAPIDLEDDNGSYEYESLILRSDNSQIKNKIIVRGGEYLGSQFTAEILANGTDTIYSLPYRYRDFSVTLTGQKLTVGIDYLNDENLYDVMYNFEEKVIKFRDARKPTIDSVMRIGGKPYLPVIIELKNQEAINDTLSVEGVGDGIYEYLIIDKSINSKEGARQRAQAEMNTYATTVIEGEFITETPGFAPGQKVRINSVSRGLDVYYIVSQVDIYAMTPVNLKYSVKLISTKVFGFIELLKRFLNQNADLIVVDPNEIIDRIESTDHELSVTESFDNRGLDYGTKFLLGPYLPSGVNRVFILNGGSGSRLN